jgi:hypothetical protein
MIPWRDLGAAVVLAVTLACVSVLIWMVQP